MANAGHGFEGWTIHSNGLREDTELQTTEILRSVHPDYHVTRTSAFKCDLLGFAAQGHASAVRDDDETYDALRVYKAPGSRLTKKPGVLKDEVKFGRWSYEWQENTFLVYEVEFRTPSMPPKKLLFVLSPRLQNTKKTMHNSSTDALLLAASAWSNELHKEIYVFDNTMWTKDRNLFKNVQDASWDEVILNRDMKANLIKDVQGFFDNHQLYKQLAVPWKRGVILHGVPGNGKTISIKALINSLASRPEPIPSLYVKSFDNPNGSPKRCIRTIFSHARTMAPCLLIFEDLDSLVEAKIRSYFLNEVDGLESNDGILMIGSTNHLDQLDSSITKRPSRFDRKYHFKIPNEEERVAYCQYWRKKLEGSNMVEFPEDLCPIIARMTEGFSFAYLKELFVIALLTIARGAVEESENVELKSDASSDGVVVDREEAATATASTEQTDSNAEAPVEEPKAKGKKTIPEVDVSEALRDNLLLRAVRAQSQMLLNEMDNSTG